uniref:Uncharacterized protein n=1 Tax=Equus caballus TaxID=9796 RepID=A0A9L0TB25_HORSE
MLTQIAGTQEGLGAVGAGASPTPASWHSTCSTVMPTTCHWVAITPLDSGGSPSSPAGGSPSPALAAGAAEPSPATLTGSASPTTSSCCGGAPAASLLRWVRSCFLRLDDTTKDFPQALQWKGRSPECTRLCLVRLALSAKARPHSSQRKGRWPECTNACLLRSQDATNVLSHCRHLNGRSPVCTRRCMA